MKKLLLLSAFAGCFWLSSSATEKYKLDDAAVNQLFAQATDVTLESLNDLSFLSNMNSLSSITGLAVDGGGQTKGCFLMRSFCCGIVGLHRSYMGTGGEAMWWK